MSQDTDPIPLPDQKQLQPGGLSNKAKRWMFFTVMGIILATVIANMIGGPASAVPAAKGRTTSQQQQNPTAAQVREIDYNLAQQQAALIEKTLQDAARLKQMQQQAGGTRGREPITLRWMSNSPGCRMRRPGAKLNSHMHREANPECSRRTPKTHRKPNSKRSNGRWNEKPYSLTTLFVRNVRNRHGTQQARIPLRRPLYHPKRQTGA